MKYNSLTLEKTKHSVAVGVYMAEHSEQYGLNNAEMYVCGLLHDVGYLDGRADHEKSGSALLLGMGLKEEYANAILYHGTKPCNVPKEIMDNPLTRRVLTLMYEADMQIDYKGHNVGFEGRLKDIGERYGKDSIAYETANAEITFVLDEKLKYFNHYYDNDFKDKEESSDKEEPSFKGFKVGDKIYQNRTRPIYNRSSKYVTYQEGVLKESIEGEVTDIGKDEYGDDYISIKLVVDKFKEGEVSQVVKYSYDDEIFDEMYSKEPKYPVNTRVKINDKEK